MVHIPLYRRGGAVRAYALVDDEDGGLAEFRWHVGSNGYARRNEGLRAILMHRVIHEPPDGLVVDHINRDKLDNRRANLRWVTRAQNQQNRTGAWNGTSRHMGVCWQRDKRRWRARPRVDGKYHHLGYFDDEDEAGRVVEEWRREFVPFASL